MKFKLLFEISGLFHCLIVKVRIHWCCLLPKQLSQYNTVLFVKHFFYFFQNIFLKHLDSPVCFSQGYPVCFSQGYPVRFRQGFSPSFGSLGPLPLTAFVVYLKRFDLSSTFFSFFYFLLKSHFKEPGRDMRSLSPRCPLPVIVSFIPLPAPTGFARHESDSGWRSDSRRQSLPP